MAIVRRPLVGILSFLLGEEYFGGLIVGIQRAVLQAGGQVIGIQTLTQSQDVDALMVPDAYVPYALDLVDGVVVIVDSIDDQGILRIVESGKPVVSISRHYADNDIPVVFPDNRPGVAEMVRHLIGHGHRRIAFVGWLPNDDVHERYEAYQAALREAGIDPDPALVFEAPDMVENGGLVAAEAMLAAGMPCTAVFVATDQSAIALMERVQAAGYTVPGDLAITGFDDSALATFSAPPLTTIRMNLDETGAAAGRLVMARIAGEPVSSRPLYVASIPVYRQSCGCRAAGAVPIRHLALVGSTDWCNDMQRVMLRESGASSGGYSDLSTPVRRIVDALDLVVRGGPLPPPGALTGAWQDLCMRATSIEGANRAFGALAAAARGRVAALASTDEIRASLHEMLDEMRLEFLYASRLSFANRARYSEAIAEKNYRVSLSLLESETGSARDLAWLGRTPVLAGCLGLWRDGAEGTELTIAGVYTAGGEPGAVSGHGHVQDCRTEQFPPLEIFETAMQAGGQQLLMVLPLISDTRAVGALALLSPIDIQTTSATTSVWQWSVLLIEALEREALVQSLRESEDRYALAARGTNDGLWDWNLRSNVVYYSPRWKQMLGYAENEVGDSPRSWFDLVYPKDRAMLETAIARVTSDRTEFVEHEYRMLHHNGEYRWMLCRGVMVWDGDIPLRMAGSQTDITARKRIEERLEHMAHHDALTGLPNRVLYHDRLMQCIVGARRHRDVFAVLILDLDNFKGVNDTLGHVIGDRLLQGFATRVRATLRELDTVARMGGDEFAVLLQGTDEPGAAVTANKLREALLQPIRIGDQELMVTASIGTAIYPTHGQTYDDLYEHADQSMYDAKRAANRIRA